MWHFLRWVAAGGWWQCDFANGGALHSQCGLCRWRASKDTLLQALPVGACGPMPALLQVWSWIYENGAYRTASLAETSATSTESNAVQVGCLRRSAAVMLHG